MAENLEIPLNILELTEAIQSFTLDDDTEWNILPSSKDLLENNELSLKPNIVNGKYLDVSNYIDTHFQLLKEDFFNPIRKDLSSYKHSPDTQLDATIIHYVQFLRYHLKKTTLCHVFEFVACDDPLSLSRDKRFMNGSLLIFSKDNLENVFYGKVVDSSNVYNLRIVVSLINEDETSIFEEGDDEEVEESSFEVEYEQLYMMIECTNFFEPYFNTLRVLKSLRGSNLPMERYVIGGSTSAVLPKYFGISPLRVHTPNLNASQNRALQGALNREFAIIQGPPGTGKTFVGLEIAKQLLQNSNLWWNESPMIVLSHSNRALDQFLEGLLTTTENLLRMGNQSKSDLLSDYTLAEWRCRGKGEGLHYKQYRDDQNQIDLLGRKVEEIYALHPTMIFHFCEFFYVSNRCPTISPLLWMLEDDGSMEANSWGFGQVDRENERSSLQTLSTWITCYRSQQSCSNDYDIYYDYCYVSVDLLNDFSDELQEHIEKKNVSKLEGCEFLDLFDIEDRELERMYSFLQRKIVYFKYCLDCLNTVIEPCEPNVADFEEPLNIPAIKRWSIYKYWVQSKEQKEFLAFCDTFSYYDSFVEQEIRERRSILHCIKQMEVVGMTTTYATREYKLLEKVKAPIVIVEEAAQILEAQVIASINKHCQHLILIGDHQQLRPSTYDYDLDNKYNLGISLFERMVINDIQCFTLDVQHRMSPEICQLITPSIYRNLTNHESVYNYANIEGMSKNLFFVDHCSQESTMGGKTCKINKYESEFVIQLAIYLIAAGNCPENITILSPYKGQQVAIEKEKYRAKCRKVREVAVKTVDDFQGAENEIILLSLVRSNAEGKIGFLANDQRVCVALSRARRGMYIVGNMQQLVSKSQLWENIRCTLLSQRAIGRTLLLGCRNHNQFVEINNANDFRRLKPPVRPLPFKCQICELFMGINW